MSLVYNDVGIVYDSHPFALAVMTNRISYAKSQKVIADLASIVYKEHLAKYSAGYVKTNNTALVYKSTTGSLLSIGKLSKGQMFKGMAMKGQWIELQWGSTKGYVKMSDVTPYAAVSQSFTSGTVKQAGVITLKRDATITSTSSKNSALIGMISQHQSIAYLSVAGDFYQVLVGNRVGYIQKNDRI
ncbi:hypothetical protein [Heyndrickxia acidicola]|uniref:SH3 domain-containing protein n=1 Tax=Heyndrickxia acidicola TaxID=209389 RepID=A0ABU6MAS8_9BACI|nr:hypothetical protein [Heyndrickxia acidicola]MED1201775.1 hypothetical protein [Heyndrickxia acidicola]